MLFWLGRFVVLQRFRCDIYQCHPSPVIVLLAAEQGAVFSIFIAYNCANYDSDVIFYLGEYKFL